MNGRFISSDPIGLRGGLNHFAYALNNPVNNTDVLGTDTWSGTGIVGGGFLGIVGYTETTLYLRNECTGQVCEVQISCWQLGMGVAIAAGTTGVTVYNGPSEGSGLAGGSAGGTIGVYMPVPIGPHGSHSQPAAGSQGTTIEGGVTLGFGGLMAAQNCTTTVLGCW